MMWVNQSSTEELPKPMKCLLSNNQQGFSLVFVAVIALIILGLGLAGWRVYEQMSAKPVHTASDNSNRSSASTSQNTQTSSNTSDQATYLDIKELGVKIKLSDEVKDAVYSVVPTTDGSKGVGISVQSLVEKSSTCDPSNFVLGLIEATTTPPTYIGGQRPLPVDNKNLFKINDTYYWYRPPQNQTCLTDNQADIATVRAKLDAFTQSFATLQLDH